ncbi:GntR family transcriptional regulator [Georgenia sp. MJ206]|uniref:GntR family transcriptional regulator n=1 Tax=Georgenia wangjunii TaxID=3117730 RepID=UPI002F262135
MKYVTVREYLRGLISDGLPVGSSIPSERSLCERFGVSRMTVRQAVDALVVEGALERVQGRGTFVAQPKVDLQLRLTPFEEEMRRRGKEPETRVLRAERVRPPADVAEALERTSVEEVYYLHRIRLADGRPMALEETWVPTILAPDLFDEGPPPNVFRALSERGLAPSWGEDTIEAVTVGPAEAEMLAVRPGAPGLRIARRTFSDDVAVEYSRSIYRGDRYSLWVPVSAPSPTLLPPHRQPGRRGTPEAAGTRATLAATQGGVI